MKKSEADAFLDTFPKPAITWIDRCKGDRRLTPAFLKGMGYKPEQFDVQSATDEEGQDQDTTHGEK